MLLLFGAELALERQVDWFLCVAIFVTVMSFRFVLFCYRVSFSEPRSEARDAKVAIRETLAPRISEPIH